MPASKTKSSVGATVRMFLHGLGDCFLITLPQKSGRDYAIVIDCGIAMGTPGEGDMMSEVVQSIAELTRDSKTKRGHVDLLVVTHEHRDHISGFIQAASDLASIDFDHVWLAWTEDPKDDLANELRAKHAKESSALQRAFDTAKSLAATKGDHQRLSALAGVLAFYAQLAAAGKKLNMADAMAAAAKLGKSAPPPFLRPGDVLTLPGAKSTGIAGQTRVFVLGPPHDGPTLRRINPGKNQETYDKKRAALGSFGMSWTWAAAMSNQSSLAGTGGSPGDESDFERSMPFDLKQRQDLKGVQNSHHSFFDTHYFNGEDYRRIDGDWLLNGAEQLALFMESYTNNTSLVLAFELPASKKVLLFVGDAQVGNWLSWHDIQEFKTPDGKPVAMHAADLLARTALYKVGHHGSHNATLREKGLELMTHPELVAMIPVEAEAVTRLGYGEMPLTSLVDALNEQADGRVLQMDQVTKNWPDGKAPGTWKTGMSPAQLAKTKFKGGNHQRPLYVEYTVFDR